MPAKRRRNNNSYRASGGRYGGIWSDYISPSIKYMRENPKKTLAAGAALTAAALGAGMYTGYIPSPQFLSGMGGGGGGGAWTGAGNYLPRGVKPQATSNFLAYRQYSDLPTSWTGPASRYMGELPYFDAANARGVRDYIKAVPGQFSTQALRNAAMFAGAGGLAAYNLKSRLGLPSGLRSYMHRR